MSRDPAGQIERMGRGAGNGYGGDNGESSRGRIAQGNSRQRSGSRELSTRSMADTTAAGAARVTHSGATPTTPTTTITPTPTPIPTLTGALAADAEATARGGLKKAKRGEMGAPPSFLDKLCHILDEPQLSQHISWNKEGDGIIVRKVQQFASQVLPKYYKHSNYQSFVRQLNIYGFHKTKHDENSSEFKQPHFRKGQRHLLGLIRRKGQATAASVRHRDGQGATEEVRGIVERVGADLRRMCNRVAHLEAEMGMINQRHDIMKRESQILWEVVLVEGGDGLKDKALKALRDTETVAPDMLSHSEMILFPNHRDQYPAPDAIIPRSSPPLSPLPSIPPGFSPPHTQMLRGPLVQETPPLQAFSRVSAPGVPSTLAPLSQLLPPLAMSTPTIAMHHGGAMAADLRTHRVGDGPASAGADGRPNRGPTLTSGTSNSPRLSNGSGGMMGRVAAEVGSGTGLPPTMKVPSRAASSLAADMASAADTAAAAAASRAATAAITVGRVSTASVHPGTISVSSASWPISGDGSSGASIDGLGHDPSSMVGASFRGQGGHGDLFALQPRDNPAPASITSAATADNGPTSRSAARTAPPDRLARPPGSEWPTEAVNRSASNGGNEGGPHLSLAEADAGALSSAADTVRDGNDVNTGRGKEREGAQNLRPAARIGTEVVVGAGGGTRAEGEGTLGMMLSSSIFSASPLRTLAEASSGASRSGNGNRRHRSGSGSSSSSSGVSSSSAPMALLAATSMSLARRNEDIRDHVMRRNGGGGGGRVESGSGGLVNTRDARDERGMNNGSRRTTDISAEAGADVTDQPSKRQRWSTGETLPSGDDTGGSPQTADRLGGNNDTLATEHGVDLLALGRPTAPTTHSSSAANAQEARHGSAPEHTPLQPTPSSAVRVEALPLQAVRERSDTGLFGREDGGQIGVGGEVDGSSVSGNTVSVGNAGSSSRAGEQGGGRVGKRSREGDRVMSGDRNGAGSVRDEGVSVRRMASGK